VTGPFARVPDARRLGVARIATVAATCLLVSILWLGGPLRGDGAALGIVSLQLAASPEIASSVLLSWTGPLRARLLWSHALDLLFPVSYALAIGVTATMLADTARQGASAAVVAAGSVLVAAVADQVENLAMWVTIVRGPSWASVLPTLVAAIVKFSALALACGALAIAAATTLRGRSAPGRAA